MLGKNFFIRLIRIHNNVSIIHVYSSSGEYDDFDDEMGGNDGEPEDPDRLIIADENADATNRLKQEIPGSGYEQSQPYTSSGMYQSNGTEPKLKGEKPPRKKHNRFNGMSEEEVAKKILPDLIAPDLDVLIVSNIYLIQGSFYLH